MSLGQIIQTINEFTVSWPMLVYVLAICLICTVAFNFIQFRYFFAAWRYMLFPEKQQAPADMTPFQAFLNSLSTGLGNGSIAGMATAIFSGGPGAAFWVLALGFIIMAVRFAEVFLGTYFSSSSSGARMGGPMLYLRSVPAGTWLTRLYVFFGLFFCFIVGNGMQTNSIGLSVAATWGIDYRITAGLLLVFMVYVVFGGAARIIKVSDRLVPIKVVTFFGSSAIVLAYHYQSLIPAIRLIMQSAFQPLALVGGLAGFTVQQAIKYGVIRSVAATESGLGTTAIFFGGSGAQDPVKTGIMSMLSTFISTLVCFIVALCILASGVWNSGLTSTALTVASFETVFGSYGGWIVSFLSITFGMGVIVSYAYVTREFWFYVTNRKFEKLFATLYCLIAFGAVFVDPTVLWAFADLPNSGMLTINLFGILWLVPVIRREVHKFMQKN
jgi:AGCS family alanine or glycine:cation symporter